MKRLVFCLLLTLIAVVHANNGNETLNHYGLIALGDATVGTKLAGRFKAKGQPVFLVHDLATGLGQGDIMRFQDKAVLVNADVWQTLQSEGALEKLQGTSLVRVTAKGNVATWTGRAKQVKSHQEQMAYLLGAELIKVLQENFGGLPGREQFVMTFDGANLQLLAPKEFLDQLRVVSVIKAPVTGKPRFISPGPNDKRILGELFFWQPMAVDPADPDGSLRYQIRDSLPPGLRWDTATHTLKGVMTASGNYTITAEVRNRLGISDTLSAHLEVVEDRPPVLAVLPKTTLFASHAWNYSVLGSDPDHPSDSLRIMPKLLPEGMVFDSIAHSFNWTPADSQVGNSLEFSFRLQDPMLRGDEYHFLLQVRKSTDLVSTEGVHLNLPFDTLVQGRTYTWNGGTTVLAWAEQGIHLKSVVGPDSTLFAGETLTLKPQHIGSHDLLFQFETPTGPMQQAMAFPVVEDQPPTFASALSTAVISVGQTSSYLPVAIDPEGAPVSLLAEIPEGSDFVWEQGRLQLIATDPGLHTARLMAYDPYGHSANQWVTLKVEPAARGTAWFLENRMEGGISTWSTAIDFGSGRMGFYTPMLFDALSFTNRSGRELPYIFFGGNLLSHNSELRGNRLYTDLGFTFRLPDPKIATGGVYGRLCGEWSFPKLGFSRVEAEFSGHVRQAIVLTDTTGIQFIFGTASLQVAEKYDPVVKKIVHDATAKDNAAFFTRIETYARLGYGFFGGLGAWREDFPMDQRFYQRVGGVLRYQARLRSAIGQMNVHSGWGPGNAGWDIAANWRLSFGAPF